MISDGEALGASGNPNFRTLDLKDLSAEYEGYKHHFDTVKGKKILTKIFTSMLSDLSAPIDSCFCPDIAGFAVQERVPLTPEEKEASHPEKRRNNAKLHQLIILEHLVQLLEDKRNFNRKNVVLQCPRSVVEKGFLQLQGYTVVDVDKGPWKMMANTFLFMPGNEVQRAIRFVGPFYPKLYLGYGSRHLCKLYMPDHKRRDVDIINILEEYEMALDIYETASTGEKMPKLNGADWEGDASIWRK